jgi:N,N'-diacetyllegionaminate synthase
MKEKIIFIAEIGMNYNGNIDFAYELIKQAKLAGADIAKFQLGWRDKPGEINNLDNDKIKKLFLWGQQLDIEIMFSIITEGALKLIQPFNANKFKIASRTLIDNIKLAKSVVKKNKLTFISLGMWKSKKLPFKKNNKIKYLWCNSKYPTHLSDLKNFPKNFKKSHYDGYSDHSIGIETCILAVCRGAKIIEKHFTLDKSDTTIRDHLLSANPEEFRLMVNISRDIYRKLNFGV